MTRSTTTRHHRPEAITMLLVDCPLCTLPAPMDADTGDLQCAACGVHLELAPEPMQLDLPLAA